MFSGLTALKRLDLQENKLASLPGEVFSGPTALTSIDLSTNALTSLPPKVFSGLTRLQTLSLQHNALTSLPAEVFLGLTALERLLLQDNDLTSTSTSLPAGAFTGLTLTTFNLGDNPDTGDTLPLTVTVEKVGTDQARAEVPVGAPFDGGLHAGGGERLAPGQRHEARRGGGLGGGHAGHGDPHVRDDGAGDGGHRPDDAADPAREPQRATSS